MSQHPEFARRRLLAGLAAVPLLPAAAGAQAPVFRQPDRRDAAGFMALAGEMLERAVAAGDQAFGAVVVRGERIVGWGPSRVVTDGDPTAHAEMVALRDAAGRLGSRDLSGCTLYGTSRPCAMCEAAAYWARIDRFVHGAALADGGRPQLRRC